VDIKLSKQRLGLLCIVGRNILDRQIVNLHILQTDMFVQLERGFFLSAHGGVEKGRGQVYLDEW